MTSDEYIQGVLEAYQGEIAGEALYRAALDATDDPSERYKFRALEQLEREMKLVLRSVVERLGGPTEETAALREAGVKFAESLFPGPDWRTDMRNYSGMLGPYVEKFKQLRAEAPAIDAEAMAHLVAHEQAQVTFATREADGDAANSIEPVLALLSEPPEQT